MTTVDIPGVGPHCRSCTTQVIWAATAAGKPMLVDAAPVSTGNVRLTVREGSAPLAQVVKPDLAFGRTDLRLAHFATCPHAASHRKRRSHA